VKRKASCIQLSVGAIHTHTTPCLFEILFDTLRRCAVAVSIFFNLSVRQKEICISFIPTISRLTPVSLDQARTNRRIAQCLMPVSRTVVVLFLHGHVCEPRSKTHVHALCSCACIVQSILLSYCTPMICAHDNCVDACTAVPGFHAPRSRERADRGPDGASRGSHCQ
jgi:hypothetical protein